MRIARVEGCPGLYARRIACGIALLFLAGAGGVQAHHTYAIFDSSKTLTVRGTVAKLEWTNPHVFVWLYVPSRDQPGRYDLYAFENGSPNASSKVGWSKSSLHAGDRITVEYWPLRDGRRGGHLARATLASGRVLLAVGGPADSAGLPRRPAGQR